MSAINKYFIAQCSPDDDRQVTGGPTWYKCKYKAIDLLFFSGIFFVCWLSHYCLFLKHFIVETTERPSSAFNR